MTIQTVVRVGLLALTIAALGFVPGVSVAKPPSATVSATGSGHFMYQGDRRTFTFNAVQLPNGNVAGHAEIHNRAQDTIIHIDIDCLVVVSQDLSQNTVVVSGTIKKNSPNPPNLVGLKGVFQAQDNGDGANSPPDRLSLIVPGDCNQTPPGLMDIEPRGNIQVRTKE